MHFHDRVYGGQDIADEVVLDILKSRLFGRLKKISMHGVLSYNGHYRGRVVSVYEHSIGSFLLAKLLGASVTEQLLALLFPCKYYLNQPKCLAYLYNLEKSTYNFSGYDIAINRLIKPFGIDCHYQMGSFHQGWPLLTLPRLDMILRDCTFYDRFDIKEILHALQYQNGDIVFHDVQIAKEIVQRIETISFLFWENPFVKLLSQYFEEAYTYVQQKRLLRQKVFVSPIDEQYKKLKALKHPHFQRKLKKFIKSRPSDFVIIDKKGDLTFPTYIKFIDPYIFHQNTICLLSDIDGEHRQTLQKRDNIHKQIHIQFL